METKTQEKKRQAIMDLGLITGRWKLTYKLVNNLGEQGFSGKLISSYTDPHTGRGRHLVDADGKFMAGYFIGQVVTILDPQQNAWHRILIDWLVGHPDVGIENNQVKLHENYIAKKSSNPRIKLVNLDYQDVEDLEQEDYIDKLVGRISLDNGVHALSREKLRFILAKLNLQYRDEKLITNPSVEKKKLRKRLKDYVKNDSGIGRAEKVNEILDNLDNAKIEYEIKEMIRLEIISNNNGMFMYEGNPLGIAIESIKNFFTNNPDFYGELCNKLYAKLKDN